MEVSKYKLHIVRNNGDLRSKDLAGVTLEKHFALCSIIKIISFGFPRTSHKETFV